jgi:hypothetical protein
MAIRHVVTIQVAPGRRDKAADRRERPADAGQVAGGPCRRPGEASMRGGRVGGKPWRLMGALRSHTDGSPLSDNGIRRRRPMLTRRSAE